MAKLKEVMEAQAVEAITLKQAEVLAQLSMSQIEYSEKARKALVVYLEDVLAQAEVTDDQARATANVLKNVTTSSHRLLCNQVLNKYLAKFTDAVKRFDARKEADEAARVAEAESENAKALSKKQAAEAAV